MKDKDSKKPVSLSMSDSLKERVRKAAEDEGMSFSCYVCRVLNKNLSKK